MARKRYTGGTWMKLTSAVILRELMATKRFDQAKLARYADCSQSFISQLLGGKKTSCSEELADHIAEALEVPTAVLFVAGESPDGRSFRKRQTRRKVDAA